MPPAPLPASAEARLDGRQGWRVTAGAFTAMFVTVGTLFAFGAFAGPLAQDLRVTRAQVGSVFALTSALFFGLGALSGAAVDRWGPRPVIGVGTVAYAVGLALTATATSLPLLVLAHGIGVGLAAACSFVPMVAVVGGWFDRRRTLALGVAVSGIGVGTLAVAPAAAALVGAFGWRRAYLVLGLAGTVLLALSAALVARPPVGVTPTSQPRREALRSRTYRVLYLAQLLLAIALFVPFVHLPGAAQARGAGSVAAAGLVGLVGGASLVGRLALVPVAGWAGLARAYQGCFLAVGVSFLFWLAGPPVLLSLHALVFGIGYGGFVALGPALLAERFGTARLGGLLGVLYTSSAIGSGLSPVLAGLLVDSSGYRAAALLGLGLGLAAFALLLRLPANPNGRGPQRTRTRTDGPNRIG